MAEEGATASHKESDPQPVEAATLAGKALVLGASGFLGSHVARLLSEAGREVRIFTRPSSDVSLLADLGLEHMHGDVTDKASLMRAMEGCSSVFHCVVDTRAWLADPAPLYRTNVDGLRNSLEAALEQGVAKFVHTSSIVTIGLNPSGVASEADAFNWWDEAPDYIRTRVMGERLLAEFVDRGLDAVACCVATTFGGNDRAPTPHGELIVLVTKRKMPATWPIAMNVVGVRDAAEAMILAEQRGRPGERYIIAGSFTTMKQACEATAKLAGVPAPAIDLPMWFMYAWIWPVEKLNRLLGRDTVLTVKSLKLSETMGDFDISKSEKELGWKPRPIEDSLREAVDYIQNSGRFD
jgi:dihydroflavonol-4-reductase